MSAATLPLPTKDFSASASLTDRARLMLAACGGVYTALLRGLHHNVHLGTLFMDPYWVNFYLTSYQDGFRRRALAGTVVRLLSPHGADVRVLNLLAAVTVFTLAALLLLAFSRICSQVSHLATLFAFALFASAFVSVDFEVLGDTLQIALLLFLAVAFASARRRPNPALRAAMLLGGMSVAFLIHEASLFFLAPAMPFLLHRSPRPKHFLLPVLAALVLFAVSVHWSAVGAHLTYPVHLYPHAAALTEPVGTPGFASLLRTEYAWDFGTHGNMLRFANRCLATALMVLAALIALASCITRAAFERIVHMLAWMSVFSSPLWIVAHDWGRFMGYNLLLAMTLSLWQRSQPATAPARILRIAARLLRLSRFGLIQLTAILLLLIGPFGHNRDLVLRPADVESAAGLLVLALIAYSARFFTTAGACL